jgi:hypothetical protein
VTVTDPWTNNAWSVRLRAERAARDGAALSAEVERITFQARTLDVDEPAVRPSRPGLLAASRDVAEAADGRLRASA